MSEIIKLIIAVWGTISVFSLFVIMFTFAASASNTDIDTDNWSFFGNVFIRPWWILLKYLSKLIYFIIK